MKVAVAACLWGAGTGWAAALALAGATPVAFGVVALYGGGYAAGTAARRRPPGRLAVGAAAASALLAFAAKAVVPGLAPWTAPLIAAAVAGALAGWRHAR